MNKAFLKCSSRYVKVVLVLLTISVLSISFTGCEPLRKKFTRKKKKGREKEIIPVLEPIDYEAVQASPEELYKKHYHMRKVWHKDLLVTLEEGGRDKHALYVIDQEIVILEEMQKLLTEAKQEELEVYIKKMRKIELDLNRPAAVRNQDAIMKNLKWIDKEIRNEFKPEIVHSPLEG